jgi:Spy/CpxP family protein refolding chaperone
VRKLMPLAVVTAFVFTSSALAWTGARQAPAAMAAKEALPSPAAVEEVLKTMRADMQTARADIMAKNVSLTAAQAAKFWPMFDTYQKEQNLVMDEQMKGVQKYAEGYQTLDDATALTLITSHLDRDARMVALRQRWLKEFQTVLPTRLAVRVLQIDRRLSLLAQLEVASKIPLVH